MNINLNFNELEAKDYWKNVNKLFSKSKKKKIKLNELEILIKFPYLRNKAGYNLVTYSFLNGKDMNIGKTLILNGHNIIKGELINIIINYISNVNILKHLIQYSIDNNINISNKKSFITDKLVNAFVSRHLVSPPYESIKYLFDKNLLDLQYNCLIDSYRYSIKFNIFKFTNDMDIIIFFNKYLKMSKSDNYLHEILSYNKLLLINGSKEYIKYIVNNTNEITKYNSLKYMIRNNVLKELIPYIYDKYYIHNINSYIKIINQIYSATNINDTKLWNNFLNIVICERPCLINKIKFYIGLFTGNIKDFELNIMKGLMITLDEIKDILQLSHCSCNIYTTILSDVNKFMTVSNNNKEIKDIYEMNELFIFNEDSTNKIDDLFTKKGYTKSSCALEKEEIMKLLKSRNIL